MIRPYLCEQPVQVVEIGHISLYRCHAGSDRLDRSVQFLSAAPGNVGMSSFRDEPLRARQTNAAIGAGDDRDLSFESAHGALTA